VENDMTFKRENKYLVFKIEDILNVLRENDPYSIKYARVLDAYNTLVDSVNSYRYSVGKTPQEYVVVGKDWPEYEIVWKMIEDRCKND
jgi:hypothetical protein